MPVRRLSHALTLGAALLLVAPAALAGETTKGGRPSAASSEGTAKVGAPGAVGATDSGEKVAASTPPAGGAKAPTLEDTLVRQGELLDRLQRTLDAQQAEIDRLRSEVESLRGAAAASAAPGATPSGTATAGSVVPAVAVAAPSAAPAATAAPAPVDTVAAGGAPASAAPGAQDDDLRKRVDELTKRWGNIRLSGDLRVRYEGFFNQGFDALQDAAPRNRERVRVRAQIASQINEHFDWAIRLATGSFNDPISTNSTLDNFYNRKPFALDRGFLHYDTKTKGANFDVYAGKFDYTWRKTAETFDPDIQPEGVSERLRFDTGKSTPLRALTLVAWQLPFKERSVGADAIVLGGQVATDWKWSDNFSTTLAGTFNDYEQIQIVPQFVNVSPALVNAGFEYGTTNTVVVNPFTGLPEYRSDYRVVEGYAELRYTGIARENNDTRWPLALRANWIRNTSAFNNQKDGGFATAEIGRRVEKGDLFFAYELYKTEREATPSVFSESDILATNAVNHRVTFAYQYIKNVEFSGQYIWSRRLQTVSPVNRWLNRIQLDVVYRF